MRILIENIGCLQTPVGSYSHKGKEQGAVKEYRDVALLIDGERIDQILPKGARPVTAPDQIIDACGCLVTPGLIDAHTHLVFGGYRQHELALKLQGADYLDILQAGGGILDTLRKTREASAEELFRKSRGFLDEMLHLGVTTCEIKSGYGLDLDNEIKQLEVIRRLGKEHTMDVVPTYLGPHAVPPEYEGMGDAYIDWVCAEVLPVIKEQQLAEYCDVFCEEGVFDAAQSERYLKAAKDLGFGLKVHADEIQAIGGTKLAGDLGAASAEHLIAITEEGLDALAAGGVTAMCLPATSFYLNKSYAPVREMIDRRIPVAIASDFNPGSCPSLNLQFVMNLGALRYKMTPEEVLTAVTINAACAIGRGELIGTIEPGKQADLVLWDVPDLEMLCYRFGSNLVKSVVKKGRFVVS